MDILIPKYTDLYVRDGEIAAPRCTVEGELRCILRRGDGSIKLITPWQKNLITDAGTQRLTTTGTWGHYLVVGTSSTPPAFTDTILGNEVGGTTSSSNVPNSATNSQAPDYIRTTMREYVFPSGVATGLLTECGLTHESGGTPRLINTHVLLDNPINKGAADHLTVEYKTIARNFTGDASGTVNISGVDYNYTVRGMNFDHIPNQQYGGVPHYKWTADKVHYRVGDGVLGTITGYPTGMTNYQPDGQPVVTAGGSLGNYYSDLTLNFGVDNGYVDAYLSALTMKMPWGEWLEGYTSASGWQVQLNKVSDGTGIYKENTHHLALQFRSYGDRYIP